MMFKRLIPALACAAMLGACATTGEVADSLPKGAPMASVMSAADAAVAAGQRDKAYALLSGAAHAAPADKAPWVRMAQMRFESRSYGEAIVNANEALQRDPEDTVAHSIAAVSGLRVTSKALGDLARKNKLTGNVKSEAEELAKLLRTSLGEEVLVTRPKLPVKPRVPAATPATVSAAKPQSTSSDPFGALK